MGSKDIPLASACIAYTWNIDIVIIQVDLNVIIFAVESDRRCILRFIELKDE
jgi:hypothetical protein